MGEQDRLGRLDVGRARQDRRPVALGEVDERPLEVEQRAVELVDRPARPEPQVRGDLVVARAAGVEAPGQRPDLLGQGRLDVHVDVLERRIPRERARRATSSASAARPVDEGLDLVRGQEPGPTEAADVGDRAGDVVGGEGGIDLDRAGEVRDARVRLAAEPPAPGPHRASGRAEVLMLPGARSGRTPCERQSGASDADGGIQRGRPGRQRPPEHMVRLMPPLASRGDLAAEIKHPALASVDGARRLGPGRRGTAGAAQPRP